MTAQPQTTVGRPRRLGRLFRIAPAAALSLLVLAGAAAPVQASVTRPYGNTAHTIVAVDYARRTVAIRPVIYQDPGTAQSLGHRMKLCSIQGNFCYDFGWKYYTTLQWGSGSFGSWNYEFGFPKPGCWEVRVDFGWSKTTGWQVVHDPDHHRFCFS